MRQVQKPPFLLVWLVCSALHFIVLFLVAVNAYAWSQSPFSRAIELGFTCFVIFGEHLAGKLTDYHGQDSIQWPLLIANSLIYGALFAILVRMLFTKKKLPT